MVGSVVFVPIVGGMRKTRQWAASIDPVRGLVPAVRGQLFSIRPDGGRRGVGPDSERRGVGPVGGATRGLGSTYAFGSLCLRI